MLERAKTVSGSRDPTGEVEGWLGGTKRSIRGTRGDQETSKSNLLTQSQKPFGQTEKELELIRANKDWEHLCAVLESWGQEITKATRPNVSTVGL